jgi:L-arabinonolactonase
VPVKNPTCPAFGGPQLNQLMVTSSRKEMNAQEMLAMPHAGSLFCLTLADTSGIPEKLFNDQSAENEALKNNQYVKMRR